MSTEEIYKIYKRHPQITTDSRSVAAGSIFFALKGEAFDGNNFAEAALRQGAAWAVVDTTDLKSHKNMILVDDVLQVLQQLAQHHRRQLGIPVIGITGSNGKTTTKELVSKALQTKFRTLATRGNLNNHIGVPLSILSITDDTEIAVIEMGANHRGEIAALCRIARPDYGIITNIGRAHLEGFGGFAGVIKAKTELYDFIRANGGHLFVHHDDELLMEKSSGIPRTTYGALPGADVQGFITEKFPSLALQLTHPAKGTAINTQLAGSYNFANVMAAVAIARYFGADLQQVAEALQNYKPVNNRSQWQTTSHNKLLIDLYNANPGSMTAVLENFALAPYANKIVILGDMLELGDESHSAHAAIIEMSRKADFEKVVLVGKQFSAFADEASEMFLFYKNSDAAREAINKMNLKNKTILLKGSRGIRLEKILDVL
ncbi:MAG: UDP-N-acetylmuramoyl-tripeptide--D-alanyl-D-alanine ligase [Victivallales bacterium]